MKPSRFLVALTISTNAAASEPCQNLSSYHYILVPGTDVRWRFDQHTVADTRPHLSTTQVSPGIAGQPLPRSPTIDSQQKTRAPESAGVELRLERGQSRGKLICAWAAASRAIGTLNGEQLT